MNGHRSVVCTVVSCALLLLAYGSARAAIIDYRVSGVVVSGNDPSGVFGAPGGSIVGDDFLAEYVFDDTKGTRFTVPPNYDDLYSSGTDTPLVWASLTIDGQTYGFNGLQSSNIFVDSLNHRTGAAVYDSATGTQTYNDSFFGTDNEVATSPSSLEQPFGGAARGLDDFPLDDFQVAYMDGVGGEMVMSMGTLDAEYVSSSISSAPEPVAWALMMVAVALSGGMLRRRAPRIDRAAA